MPPLHPAFVHFPIALVAFSFVTDLLGRLLNKPSNSARPHRVRLSLDSGLGDPNTMSAQDLIERLIRRPVQR
jgi:hypothetical protein